MLKFSENIYIHKSSVINPLEELALLVNLPVSEKNLVIADVLWAKWFKFFPDRLPLSFR